MNSQLMTYQRMTSQLPKWLLLSLSFLFSALPASVSAQLTIGITLHPYYSYVKNIAGDKAKVTPLIEAGFNPHSYKLSPADLKRLKAMDVIVVNGIGHDEFAIEVIKKLNLPELNVINANDAVPLIGNPQGTKFNPHTFVSIDATIRQVYTIARALAKLDPDNGKYFQRNALNYARQLRQLKTQAQQKLTKLDLSQVRIASTHNAYGYLLQEFGMTVSAVIEPAHGVSPNASQLQGTIDKIRNANVQILFTELNMPNQYVDVIERETSTQLYHFSHMTYGDYREDLVVEDMSHNLDTLIQAVQFAAQQRHDG